MTAIVVFIEVADFFALKKDRQVLMRQNKSSQEINNLIQVSGGKSQTETAALKEQKGIFCLVCVPQVMT
jgi:hypothetical protein